MENKINEFEDCFIALEGDAHLNTYGKKEVAEIYSTIQDICRIAIAYYQFDPNQNTDLFSEESSEEIAKEQEKREIVINNEFYSSQIERNIKNFPGVDFSLNYFSFCYFQNKKLQTFH